MKIKIPEKPPKWEMTSETLQSLPGFLEKEEVQDLIRRTNREYIPWEQFKYKFPENLGDPKIGWLLLKLSRMAQAKPVPLKDKQDYSFKYWMPDEIVKKLHLLDSLAGGQILIEEPVLNKEEKDRYLANSLMEEAISSSLLEGAATTREKAKQMLLSGKKPRTHPDKMIFNNYRTINKINQWKNKPLTLELLKEIHFAISENTLKNPDAEGRFRNKDDKPIEVQDDYGTTLFIPPPVNEIENRLRDLIDFTNREDPEQEFIHPIIKAIILHFYLAYVHPFVDGNGRTARALFYWYMLKKGYWLSEYISISRFILESPSQYAKAYLHTETDDQDLNYFIHYNLIILCKAFDELKQFIADQQKRIKQHSELLRKFPDLNYRQTTLLQHACRHPNYIYTIQKHKNYHGITYQTARTDLLDLMRKGFLEKNIKSGKTFYFNLSNNFEQKLETMDNQFL